MAQGLNQISNFEKPIQNIESDKLLEFLCYIINNLNDLSSNFGDVKYREELSKLKEYLGKLMPLVKVALERKENDLPQREIDQFKKLLMKKVEKVAFRNILR